MKTKHFSGIIKVCIFSYDKVGFYWEILRFNGSVQLLIEKKLKKRKPKRGADSKLALSADDKKQEQLHVSLSISMGDFYTVYSYSKLKNKCLYIFLYLVYFHVDHSLLNK